MCIMYLVIVHGWCFCYCIVNCISLGVGLFCALSLVECWLSCCVDVLCVDEVFREIIQSLYYFNYSHFG